MFAWSSPATGRVRRDEAPSSQTWHHQCAGSWGSLGHIPQRPAGESDKHYSSVKHLQRRKMFSVGLFAFIRVLCIFFFWIFSWILQILDYCSYDPPQWASSTMKCGQLHLHNKEDISVSWTRGAQFQTCTHADRHLPEQTCVRHSERHSGENVCWSPQVTHHNTMFASFYRKELILQSLSLIWWSHSLTTDPSLRSPSLSMKPQLPWRLFRVTRKQKLWFNSETLNETNTVS